MKIKRLNPSTLPTQLNGSPAVRIHESGNFIINQAACEVIGLTGSDQIEIIEDEDSKRDFYLVKSTTGFKLRMGKGQSGLMLQSASLARIILTKIPPPDTKKSICVPLAKVPTVIEKESFYPLITAAIK